MGARSARLGAVPGARAPPRAPPADRSDDLVSARGDAPRNSLRRTSGRASGASIDASLLDFSDFPLSMVLVCRSQPPCGGQLAAATSRFAYRCASALLLCILLDA